MVGTFWVSLRADSDSLAKLPARPLAAAQVHQGPYDELPPTHDLQWSEHVPVPSQEAAVSQYKSVFNQFGLENKL